MSKQHLKIRKGLYLQPQASAPADPAEGDLYFDSTLGLQLYKNGVWATAGGAGGDIKVDLIDRVSTTKPTVDPASIDGVTVVAGTRVLFSNLTVGDDQIWKATVSGGTISWSAEPDFEGLTTPSTGSTVRITDGSVYGLFQFVYDGSDWIPSTTLQSAYDFSDTPTITTDATKGDFTIAGTEKLVVLADGGILISAGGLDVTDGGVRITNGLLETTGVAGGSTLDVDQESLATTSTLDTNALTWRGQSFTTVNGGDVNQVSIEIDFVSVGATGTVRIDIYTVDGGGLPDTLLGSSDAIGVGSLTVPGLNYFNFSSPVTLAPATQYAIVLYGGNLPSGSVFWPTTTVDTYPGGQHVQTGNGGSSWSALPARDKPFGIYVTSTALSNIRMNGSTSGYLDIKVPATVTSYDLTLPSAQGGADQVLKNDGSGNLSWSTITFPSTDLQTAYVNGETITTDNSNGDVSIAGTEKLNISAAGGVLISAGGLDISAGGLDVTGGGISVTNGGASITGGLFQTTANGANYNLRMNALTSGFVQIKAADTTTSYSLTMPNAVGAADTYLKTDNSGNLSWAAIPAATTTLQGAYDNGSPGDQIVTTNATNGDVRIGGTEQFRVITDKGGDFTVSSGAFDAFGAYVSGTGTGDALNAQVSSGDGRAIVAVNDSATGVTLWVKNLNTTGPLLRLNGATSGNLDIKVPAAITTHTWTLPGAQGGPSTYLQNNGSGVLSWTSVAASFNPASRKTAAYIAADRDDILADTAAVGAFTITLPDNPTGGERIRIQDAERNFGTNNLTVAVGAGGATIYNAASPLTIDEDGVWAEFLYDATDNDWKLYGPIAAGSIVTFQSIYEGDPANNPVAITTTASVGDIRIGGTEGFEVTAAGGFSVNGTTASIDHNTADATTGILDVNQTGTGVGLSIDASGGIGSRIANSSGSQATLDLTNNNASRTLLRLHRDISNYIDIKVDDSAFGTYTLKLPPGQGLADQVLKNDGSGNLTWATVDGWITQQISAAGPHATVNLAELFLDTSSNTITINMPTATQGHKIRMIDYGYTWDTNNVTVNGNGGDTFDGLAGPLTLNTAGSVVEFLGDGNGNWRVIVLK